METAQFMLPPPEIKGAVTLDRKAITKCISVLAIAVAEADVGKLVKIMKKFMFHMRGVKVVQPLEDGNTKRKVLLLDPVAFSCKEDIEKLVSNLPAVGEVSFELYLIFFYNYSSFLHYSFYCLRYHMKLLSRVYS